MKSEIYYRILAGQVVRIVRKMSDDDAKKLIASMLMRTDEEEQPIKKAVTVGKIKRRRAVRRSRWTPLDIRNVITTYRTISKDPIIIAKNIGAPVKSVKRLIYRLKNPKYQSKTIAIVLSEFRMASLK